MNAAVLSIAACMLAGPSGAVYVPSDPMRYTTWNPGLNSVGGIPNRATVCANLSPGGGDDSAAIQSALDACPDGQVVRLSAGEFIVNDYLTIRTSITLRGAGPGSTILRKTNGATSTPCDPAPEAEPVIIVGPARFGTGPDESTAQDLAADGNKGEDFVDLTNASGFSPGRFVLLDELSNSSWQPDRAEKSDQIWASPDYRVTWQFHDPEIVFVDDPLLPTKPTSGPAASWFSRQDRVTAEIKEIASVAGNRVTFTSPLHINYRANPDHNAQLTSFPDFVRDAGIEDLTVTGGSNGNVRFQAAAYSWAKNVELDWWLEEGFPISNSFRVEIRDSYLHDHGCAQPSADSYLISLSEGSSEVLIENNVLARADKMMVARCAGAGSVVGYNYADQGYINYIPGWIEVGLNASHMVGPHHVLFEGNYGFNWDSDVTHGNSIYMTIFRNHLRGMRTPFTNQLDGIVQDDNNDPGAGPKRVAGAQAYSYWMTFVGNVLGSPGQMTGWTYDASGPAGWNTDTIWLLGWDTDYFDPEVRNTAVRDGNWDWVQGQQTWHNTPTGDHDLPDSLYLSSKPAFFGSLPWPWVDPTTGNVATLPAQVRFNGLLVFADGFESGDFDRWSSQSGG
jgi:hypothetical protein